MGRHKRQEQVRGTNAVIYLRVSTDEQAKPGHFGLDAQLELCTTYCQKQGYAIIEVAQDKGISGTKPIAERPGIERAITLCEQRKADVIVAYAQDRYARKTGVLESLLSGALRYKYRIETSDGSELTDLNNEMVVAATSFVATIEARLIAKRLYGGRQQRSKVDGMGSGPLPYAYRRTTTGNIQINENEAHIARIILLAREIHTPYRKIAEGLNTSGYKTAKGTVWTPGSVETITRHERLYRAGVKTWGKVQAFNHWPTIYDGKAE